MPTLAQAKKAWEHGRKSQNHYNALTSEQKAAFWDYGYGQGLFDPNNLDDYKKSEFNRYATKTLRFAPQVATSKTMYDVKTSKDEYDNEGNPKKVITTTQKLVPGNGVYDRYAIAKPSQSVVLPSAPVNTSTDKRRLLNEERIAELTPERKPLPMVPQLPTQKNDRQKKAVVQQGKKADPNIIRPNNPFAAPVVNAVNTASLGLLERNTNAIDTLREEAPIASTVGSIAGYALPFGAAKGALVKGTQAVGKRLLTDAAIGAGIDTATELTRGKLSAENAAKNVAQGAIIGIAADLALSALGSAGKAISRKLVNKQTLSAAEKAIVDKLPEEAKKEIIFYVDQYGNTSMKPEPIGLLEAPKTDLTTPKLLNREAPFTVTKAPTIEAKPLSNINTLPIEEKSLTGQIKPSNNIASNAAQTAKEAVEKAPAKKDISGFQAYTTDVYRNFEQVFGDDFPAVKKDILDPFDNAKKAKTIEDRQLMADLKKSIVDKFNIQKGSKESALIQQYGEKRLSKEALINAVGETRAKDIMEADEWFRSEYNKLIDEINEARAKIYPNVENNIQDTKNKIAKYIDTIQTKTKELETANPDTKKYENLQRQISNLKDRVNRNQDLLQSDELWRGKRILKREDYYRHFNELSNDFEGLKNIFETPSQISPSLAGISEYTKPNAKFLSIAQRRGQGKFTDDAVGGFLDYINAATYAKHIDPQIPNFRRLEKDLAESTMESVNMNHFLEYLKDFTDDLAGKTNPADRFVQKIIPGGRTTFKALNWLNSRVKANTILGNLSSSLSQIANIPQGIAYVKNPEHLAKGAGKFMASIFGKGDAALYKKSGFLLERYSDNIARQFDTKLLDQPKKAAAWMLGALDEVGTKSIWSSVYQKGLADGVKDPIKYADDVTRKLVAGRGIGEVPLLQKSKIMQLVAPFTLEVNNLWKVQKDFIKAKDFGGLAMLYLANFALNKGMEEVRGDGVVFDPIQAIYEALSEEDLTALERAGRLGGEVLSNVPLGSTAASLYPEYGVNNEFVSLPTREKLFGRNDPTRFGGGLLVAKGIQDPLYKIAPPFAGGQIKKTVQAGQDLALLPKAKKEEGKLLPKLERQVMPASYSNTRQGDRLRTTIDPTPGSTAKGLLFGRGAIPELKKYYESGKTPFGTKQTENFKKLVDKGYEPNKLFEALNGIRGTAKKTDIVVKLRENGYNDKQITEIWEIFYK